MMLTHGSLFAGIGGFDLGFARAGIKTIWAVEIDTYCQAVLRKNFPETEIYSDVKKVGKHNLKPVDIISGGFPCQPFSQSGKRRGSKDNRHLWPEMRRVIKEIRPTWAIAENVTGLESMGFAIEDVKVASRIVTRYSDSDYYKGIYTLKERMYIDYFCEQFEEIGYDVIPIVIPACAVGAFHLRRRVWILAYAESQRRGKTREYIDRSEIRTAKCGEDVADTNSTRLEKRQGYKGPAAIGTEFINRTDVSNPDKLNDDNGRYGTSEEIRRRSNEAELSGSEHWSTESGIRRVAHGIPRRVDRLKGLGNAIVPQIAEMIGHRIVELTRGE